MDVILGADIGTTHIKVVTATTSGKTLSVLKRSVTTSQPAAGFHEQSPEEIFRDVIDLCNKALDEASKAHRVLAISFSTAMHSLLLTDEYGRALTPMLTWADIRSTAQADELKNTVSVEQLYHRTGTPLHPMSPLCKLIWFRENEPALFDRAARFVSFKEFLFYHLTGDWLVDYSMASATGLFDSQRLQWDSEALELAGVKAERLAEPVPVTYMCTGDKLLLSVNNEPVKLIIGGSDGAMANLGAGAIGKGRAAVTIGTSGALRLLHEGYKPDRKGQLFFYLLDENMWITGGAINNGGLAIEWLSGLFDKPVEDLLQEIEAVAPGSDGLLCVPYLQGERFPVWDAKISGSFAGLRAYHTRAHFVRAIVEGICYGLHEVSQALRSNEYVVTELIASGGFTQSAEWVQMLADITGLRVNLPSNTEASAMGAIFTALYALGLRSSWDEAAGFIREEKIIQPDESRRAVYEDGYRRYLALRNVT